jgi:hypothetical protein
VLGSQLRAQWRRETMVFVHLALSTRHPPLFLASIPFPVCYNSDRTGHSAEAAPCSGPMRTGVGSKKRINLFLVTVFRLLTSSNGNDGAVRAEVSLPAQLGFRLLDEHRTVKICHRFGQIS